MKAIVLVCIALLSVTSAARTIDVKDTRVMSDAEYHVFLKQVEAQLAELERALRSVDPAKSKVSYAVGEKVVEYRNLGLMQLKNAGSYVRQERIRRRVSKELVLRDSLQAVFDSLQNVILEDPTTDVPLENYAPGLGKLILRVANDVLARVELLEQGTCPP
jgi:hypothetical protein